MTEQDCQACDGTGEFVSDLPFPDDWSGPTHSPRVSVKVCRACNGKRWVEPCEGCGNQPWFCECDEPEAKP